MANYAEARLTYSELENYRKVRARAEMMQYSAAADGIDVGSGVNALVELWNLEAELFKAHNINMDYAWDIDPRTGGIFPD